MQILDTNPQLFFHLQQQKLIELIRNSKIEEALEFAQEELAPRGEENVMFRLYWFVYLSLIIIKNNIFVMFLHACDPFPQPISSCICLKFAFLFIFFYLLLYSLYE